MANRVITNISIGDTIFDLVSDKQIQSSLDEILEGYAVDASAMSVKEKVLSVFGLLRSAVCSNIADVFSEKKEYEIGSLVVYEDGLYICTVRHDIGAWDSSHFERTTVDNLFMPIFADYVSANKLLESVV